jgi:hypothetical protein
VNSIEPTVLKLKQTSLTVSIDIANPKAPHSRVREFNNPAITECGYLNPAIEDRGGFAVYYGYKTNANLYCYLSRSLTRVSNNKSPKGPHFRGAPFPNPAIEDRGGQSRKYPISEPRDRRSRGAKPEMGPLGGFPNPAILDRGGGAKPKRPGPLSRGKRGLNPFGDIKLSTLT